MAHDAPTALNLPMVDPLPEATQKYFDVCQQKLGMVPNVLRAYAFDIDKLNAFAAMYNDLMLGGSNLSKLEREMIAVSPIWTRVRQRCWLLRKTSRWQVPKPLNPTVRHYGT